MAKKNKNGKRVYEHSRRECIKDFDATLTNFQVNIDGMVTLLSDAETLVTELECDGSRKEIAKELENIYDKLKSMIQRCQNDDVEGFGICIDRLIYTK